MLRTKSFSRSVVLSLLVVLAVSSLAIAQERNRGRGRGGFGAFGRGGFGTVDAVDLAQMERVQSELKLTSEQKSRVNELAEMSREEGRKLYTGLRDLPQEERGQKFAEMREKREKLSKEMDEMLYEALDEGQSKRLKELVIQRQGVRALRNDAVAKELALTDEQKSKINSVFEQQGQKLQELFTPGERPDRSKFEELNKETEQQAMAALTAEQKEQFQKMQGEKFDFPQFGRRGPGGRGRRTNNNN